MIAFVRDCTSHEIGQLIIGILCQTKSKVQEVTQEAFGIIHDIELADCIEKIVALLQNVVSSLPLNQSESISSRLLSWIFRLN